ncbi:hypothetical protein AOXY_G14484 [Acipenser oxyrinchus oxyrinchus]|uniref:Uncharacterized protein n=1 Tax=Acipenser oxyrinchus oxyrinchus TaxID=40147 RepID=A0AAD8G6H3_ACIOX|nr:hypothetical protein AOXY_G14484 [Acipenser oxyrinchus oxyrinchus]
MTDESTDISQHPLPAPWYTSVNHRLSQEYEHVYRLLGKHGAESCSIRPGALAEIARRPGLRASPGKRDAASLPRCAQEPGRRSHTHGWTRESTCHILPGRCTEFPQGDVLAPREPAVAALEPGERGRAAVGVSREPACGWCGVGACTCTSSPASTTSCGFNRAVPPGPRASNGCPDGNSSSSVGSSPLLHCPLPSDLALTLVGFSKGCVVLNQLVYELRGARADPELAPFVASITDMYWLDGGHPGGSNTWVTSQESLKDLASSGIGVHSHVTPYEVCDPMWAWVGKEHKRFVRALRELGVPIVDKLHFENQLPSLEQHFRVLEEF